jgi:serine/threonine protein kinase
MLPLDSHARMPSHLLGIILYTMLFGRYPFCDRTLVGLFIKIGRCRPDIPRSISLKARSLLRSLIRVRPNERLSAHDILGHVWFNGERDLTAFSSSILTSVTGSDESTSIFSSQHNSNDKSVLDDAVVPNFACE